MSKNIGNIIYTRSLVNRNIHNTPLQIANRYTCICRIYIINFELTLFSGMIVKDFCITCTNESIAVESGFTGTHEAAQGVSAIGISATTSVVCCTLVDIWVTT